MRKSKAYHYLLGIAALCIGGMIGWKAIIDIVQEEQAGQIAMGSPVGFVGVVYLVAAVLCVAAGILSIRRASKNSRNDR